MGSKTKWYRVGNDQAYQIVLGWREAQATATRMRADGVRKVFVVEDGREKAKSRPATKADGPGFGGNL